MHAEVKLLNRASSDWATDSEGESRIDYPRSWHDWNPCGHILAERVSTARCFWCWWLSMCCTSSFTSSALFALKSSGLPFLYAFLTPRLCLPSWLTCRTRRYYWSCQCSSIFYWILKVWCEFALWENVPPVVVCSSLQLIMTCFSTTVDCFVLVILYLWVELQVCEGRTSQIFCQTVKNRPHPSAAFQSSPDPNPIRPLWSSPFSLLLCEQVCVCAYIFGMVLEGSGGGR